MRHQKAKKNLGCHSSHGKAILRNMVTSLFKHEQIQTTDVKAKHLKPVAEKMITLAKRGDLHARRQALSYMRDKTVTHKLFEEIKERFIDRQGGYVRILKKGRRRGDNAPVSIIQLLPGEETKKKVKKKRKSAEKKTKAPSKPKKAAPVEKTKEKAEQKTPTTQEEQAPKE